MHLYKLYVYWYGLYVYLYKYMYMYSLKGSPVYGRVHTHTQIYPPGMWDET